MNDTVLQNGTKSIGKSNLDYLHFQKLSQEALRLIRSRRDACDPTDKNCRVIQDQVEDIKEVTKAVVSDRLSTSQR